MRYDNQELMACTGIPNRQNRLPALVNTEQSANESESRIESEDATWVGGLVDELGKRRMMTK